MKIRNKHPLFQVVTEAGESLAACMVRPSMPSILLHSAHVSLFRSHRQARSYVLRTAKWAREEKMPWAREVRRWRVVPVTLHLSNAVVSGADTLEPDTQRGQHPRSL